MTTNVITWWSTQYLDSAQQWKRFGSHDSEKSARTSVKKQFTRFYNLQWRIVKVTEETVLEYFPAALLKPPTKES